MLLTTGTRLGPYEVVAPLGVGAMGEVYRARDTQLDRDVALKILPPVFATDPERLARFEREAKTLAALNHPCIASIYGLEKTPSTGSGQAGPPALVMELVPGRTLDEIIAAEGPLPPDTAAQIAAQIADGLEAAHEAGIVHRDLKPANIKRRDDGVVKILDFGLARAMDSADAMADAMASPTMLSPAMTQRGVILGTAGYMSPEQAKGRVADKRSDIWAFGVVLYEMLTGKRLFTGDTVTEVIATVIKDAPNFGALPSGTPPGLRALLERCLDRDLKTRLRDIGEARIALGRVNDPPPLGQRPTPDRAHSPARPAGRELVAWGLAAMAVVAFGLRLARAPQTSATDGPVVRTMIPPPDDTAFDFDVTVGPAVISPDGRMVAFSARSRDGRIQLWIRALDSTAAHPVDGTDGASFPFWSPDSRSVGFYSSGRGRLERVDVAGGAPVAIVRAGFVRGASWGSDGTIAYDASEPRPGISVVNVAGGTPRMVVEAGDPRSPWILPGSKHLLYYNRIRSQVRVVAIDGTGDELVTDATSAAIYAGGQLLFLREGTLLAQPFDLARRAASGSPVAIARDVQMLLGDPRGVFSASETGTLLYQDAGAEAATSLAWFDRTGTRQALVGEIGSARGVVLSPDNQLATVGMLDVENRLALWRVNLSNNQRNRLTYDTGVDETSPFFAWSPDGRTVAYSAKRQGKVVVARTPVSGGQEEPLFDVPFEHTQGGTPRVTAWTKDALAILYSGLPKGGLWRLPLRPGVAGARLMATALLKDADSAVNVRLSPNEHWISYQSAVGGGTVTAVFVDAYPGGGHRQQVSERSSIALWSADGKSLYFAVDNQLSVVEATEADGTIHFGPPRTLMPVIVGRGYSYDVAKDGRILALVTSEGRASRPLTLVQHWLAAPALAGR